MHLAIIQVQVLKQYKKNKAILEWSAKFKKVSNETPTEEHMKRDPEMEQALRKTKVANQLLKMWKITVHLPN